LTSFAARYPDRFFDVGICEEHAVIFAAGLATQGMSPVLPLYSTFSQRVVDYILHDVCLQNLPVVICLDRAGIVGDDGPTHHGVYDIALMRTFPKLTIMQPADGAELAHMLYSAVKWKCPVVIRYPRGICHGYVSPDQFEEVVYGKARVLREGWEIQIWALGDMIPAAIAVADTLVTRGYSAGVVDARFVVPLDQELIAAQSQLARAFVTLENGVGEGGFGTAIAETLGDLGFQGRVIRNGWPREFIPHGAPAILLEKYGLTAGAIVERVERVLRGQMTESRIQNPGVRIQNSESRSQDSGGDILESDSRFHKSVVRMEA
jgi:1-deoxy-D-xylulose-5-phosphate synthase